MTSDARSSSPAARVLRAALTLPLVVLAASCFVNDVFKGEDGDACIKAEDCEVADDPCIRATCVERVCGIEAVPDGVVSELNVSADCHTISCVNGKLVDAVDDLDRDDDDPCTDDDCEAGVPVHDPVPAGGPCQIGTSVGTCDENGTCEVDCFHGAPCPSEPCVEWTCENGKCVGVDVDGPPIKPVSQPPGDCQRNACVEGELVSVDDDTDLPVDFPFDCESPRCTDGAPDPLPAMPAAVCGGATSNLTCVAGSCEICAAPADCVAPMNTPIPACQVATCEVTACKLEPAPEDSPCILPGGGDGTCNADGVCIECESGEECDDGGTCRTPECIDGRCVLVDLPDLTACGSGCCVAGACQEACD